MNRKHLTDLKADGANVFAGRDCVGMFDTDNADLSTYEAKAKLFASAPALLAAAEALANSSDYDDDRPLMRGLRDAIAKARAS